MINYSIIIPHHNIPLLLSRCLKSIPERNDIQVIVVDDNSVDSDKIPILVPEINRNNVEYYRTTEGKGAGFARNIGLGQAKGKWLIFADADDFFTKEFVSIIDKYCCDNADIVFFNNRCCECDNIETELPSTMTPVFEKFQSTKDERLFRMGYAMPWGKMIRRSLVVKNGIKFDETLVANDYLFSIKTGIKALKIKPVNEKLYVYTHRNGSLTNVDGFNMKRFKNRFISFINVQKYMEDEGYYSSPRLCSYMLNVIFKHHTIAYLKFLVKLKKSGLSITPIIIDLLKHYYGKLVGRPIQYREVYYINWYKK